MSPDQKFAMGLEAEDLFFQAVLNDKGSKPVFLGTISRGKGTDEVRGIDGFVEVVFDGYGIVSIPFNVKTSENLFAKHYEKHPLLKGVMLEVVVHTWFKSDWICRKFYAAVGEMQRTGDPSRIIAQVQILYAQRLSEEKWRFAQQLEIDRFVRSAKSLASSPKPGQAETTPIPPRTSLLRAFFRWLFKL